MRWTGNAPRWWPVATFVLLTALYTFPQVVSPRGLPEHQDPLFGVWRFAWVAHQLPRDPLALFDANIFTPTPRTFALSDAALLQGLAGAPLVWSGVPPDVVYNLAVFLSFATAGAAMYLLAVSVTGSRTGALVAGLIYAFTPYRFEHYMHLELLWTCWIPLAFWAVHRTVRAGRLRDGVIVGLCGAAQTLSSVYYGVFLATALVPFVLLVWWAEGGTSAARATAGSSRPPTMRVLASLAAGAVVWGLFAVPYALPYARNTRDVGVRSVEETASFSATAADFLSAPPMNWLRGHAADEGSRERRLFPGFAAVALALVGVVTGWRDRRTWAYLVLGLLMLDLMFGYNGLLFAGLRRAVPLYVGLRVPPRLWVVASASLAVLAAWGTARILARARQPLVAAALVTAVGVEYVNRPLDLGASPPARTAYCDWLARQPRGIVLELPLPRADRLPGFEPNYQAASIHHWQPLINGYSGFYPEHYIELIELFRTFPRGAWLEALEKRHVRYIAVHEHFMAQDDLATMLAALEERPETARVGHFPDRGDPVTVFTLATPP
ncbi:MAG: DUF6044 family protein [Vicinamibacterales bacterium]